jgi:hypothetical protein
VNGLYTGVPIEIYCLNRWFTTEIADFINDETVYLTDIQDSEFYFNDPVSLKNVQFRLLGKTYNYAQFPCVGDLIQVILF